MAATQKFTNSGLVSFILLSPHNSGLRIHNIDTISVHTIAGNMTAENCARMFAGNTTQASSNYIIGSDGKIAMSVEEKNRSWCSSNAPNDQRAITIEVASLTTTEPFACSQQAWNSLVDLCTDICERNNIKELKWKADKSLIGQVDKQNMTVHRWFANKSCIPITTMIQAKGNDGHVRNKPLHDITLEDSIESYTVDGKFTTWKHVCDIIEPHRDTVYEFACGIVATIDHRLLVKRSPSEEVPTVMTVEEILDDMDKIGATFYVPKDENSYVALGNILSTFTTAVGCITVPDGFIKVKFSNDEEFIIGNCPGEYLYSRMGDLANQVNNKLKLKNATYAGTTIAARTTVSNEDYIWSYLRGKQLNSRAVAGIMGCMQAESGFIPNNLENTAEKKLGLSDSSYTTAVDKNAYPNFAKDGYGYGLCQWTYSIGKQRLLDFAKQRKKSVGDLYTQCEFFWWDLNTNFKTLKSKLVAAKSVSEALRVFLDTYEYGGHAPDNIYNKRLGYANTIYNKHLPKQTTTPTPAKTRKVPYIVKVEVSQLNVRKGPGSNYPVSMVIKDMSGYTIVEEKTGPGAKLWGRLKSGAGWIALDYTKFLKNV